MLTVRLFLQLCFVDFVVCKGGPRGEMSDQWLMKVSDSSTNIRRTTEHLGFEIVSEPFPGFVLLKKSSAMQRRNSPADKQRDVIKVELKTPTSSYTSMKQMEYKNMSYRGILPRQSRGVTITDSFWSSMWYIQTDQFPSMHVYDVWQMGYTGSGVHVTILDDGVEPTHRDLVNNYIDALSFDYIENISYVAHSFGDDHGTMCAGIVAAEKNNECVLGIAYEATFSSAKVFDGYNSLTEADSALSLIHALDHTDIYSNSYGPDDSGSIFEGPTEIELTAFKKGVTKGRDGKGAIYVWANGNGGADDDCNCDGFANSIYTIAVSSVDSNQEAAYYSESCSSVLVSTYGGSSPNRITTTTTFNGCTRYFQGTSAACPMASGIIALVLQARPDLTWRDVQHLIVETASKEGLIRADWQTNGAGKQISHQFGFGLLDASAMVSKSVSWTLVKEQVTCESIVIEVNSSSSNGAYVTSTVDSDGCGSGGVGQLEHVQVWIHFWSTDRGLTEIKLMSPQGTKSVLLHERTYDYYNGATEWTFMTVHTWGETPLGTWTLQMEGLSSSLSFGLDSWKLILYGTSKDVADQTTVTDSIGASQSPTDSTISGRKTTAAPTSSASTSTDPISPTSSISTSTKSIRQTMSTTTDQINVISTTSPDPPNNENSDTSTDDNSVTYGVVGGVLGGVAVISGASGVGIFLLKKTKKVLPIAE